MSLTTLLSVAGITSAMNDTFEREFAAILHSAFFTQRSSRQYEVSALAMATAPYHYIDLPDPVSSITNGAEVQSDDAGITVDPDVAIMTTATPASAPVFPYARHGHGIIVNAITPGTPLIISVSAPIRDFLNIDPDVREEAKALLFALKTRDVDGLYTTLQRLSLAKQNRIMERSIDPAPIAPVGFAIKPMEL